MWNAVRLASGRRIVVLLIGQMVVDSHQNVLETLGRIVHVTQLEFALIGEGFGQCKTKGTRLQNLFTATLELMKQFLQVERMKIICPFPFCELTLSAQNMHDSRPMQAWPLI